MCANVNRSSFILECTATIITTSDFHFFHSNPEPLIPFLNIFQFSAHQEVDLASINENARVEVFASGLVRWTNRLTWETTCQLDISQFPYDEQECSIRQVYVCLVFLCLQLLIYDEFTKHKVMHNLNFYLHKT